MVERNEPAEEVLSKTKKKQQAKQVELIAEQLTGMADNQLSQLVLPETLVREINLARATQGRSSYRRQLKHLAGVLRKQDEVLDDLLGQLQQLDQVGRQEKKQFHQLESLRDRLCQESSFAEAVDELAGLVPASEIKVLSRLARSVHQNDDRRASREVFRRLKKLLADQA